jgi:hypothetical protein
MQITHGNAPALAGRGVSENIEFGNSNTPKHKPPAYSTQDLIDYFLVELRAASARLQADGSDKLARASEINAIGLAVKQRRMTLDDGLHELRDIGELECLMWSGTRV